MNPLEASGRPLFFEAAPPVEEMLWPPARSGCVSIRTIVRSLSLMQKEALVTSDPGGRTWRVASDEGAYLMGDDVAPCPLAHMTTGMVACFMEELLRLAREAGRKISDARLIQDNFYTMQGSALKGTMIGGALPVELRLEASDGSDSRELEDLLREAVRRAPVIGLIERATHSRFTLTHNGHQITTGRVHPVTAAPPAYSAGPFDSVMPGRRDWTGLVTRNGMSPPTDEITSSAGSSFAEEQSRRLHVRGICTLRPDGVKQIEQHLLNPHGSVFYFLSEESPEAGGMGRAPDALSFVSAGIGFCFMTQIGRYARIVRKDLHSYAIIQDTHFAAGRHDVSADPVETHVYVTTGEDDDFVRTALDMSEQTCFLHALCRTDVDVRTTVSRPSEGGQHRS